MKVVNSQWSVSKMVSCLAPCALLFALCFPVSAQQPSQVPRIGFLSATSPSIISTRVEAFRQGLRELGYVEAKNIVTEYRFAEGKLDRLRNLAAELVRLRVEVIVTAGPTVTRPVKEATSTIPIVMAFDDDLVGSGFVASLARPGGNITGLSILAPEISGKQLELLKEIIPRLSRVAVLGSSTRSGTAQALKETELAAGAFGVQVQYLDILGPKDVETTFREASRGVLRQSSCCRAPSSMLIENKSPISQQRAGCRRYTTCRNLCKKAAL
jgi:putative ABC transport system substrate-binding protein